MFYTLCLSLICARPLIRIPVDRYVVRADTGRGVITIFWKENERDEHYEKFRSIREKLDKVDIFYVEYLAGTVCDSTTSNIRIWTHRESGWGKVDSETKQSVRIINLTLSSDFVFCYSI